MTVGVISAIPEEYSKLKWDSEPKTETIINKIFQFGNMNGVKVIAAECGIGKVNASMTTALLLGHFGCDSIVFSGVAGGLNPEYKIGDVIIGEQLVQHDYGAIVDGQLISAIPGVFPGMVDENEDTSYKMSPEMRNVIADAVGDKVILPKQDEKLMDGIKQVLFRSCILFHHYHARYSCLDAVCQTQGLSGFRRCSMKSPQHPDFGNRLCRREFYCTALKCNCIHKKKHSFPQAFLQI